MLMKSTPGLNFTNILQAAFLYTKVCCAVFLYLQFSLKKFVKRLPVQKQLIFLVKLPLDPISSTFFEQLLCGCSFAKKLQRETLIREKLP